MNKSLIILRWFRERRLNCLSPSVLRTLKSFNLKCHTSLTLLSEVKLYVTVNACHSSDLVHNLSMCPNQMFIRNYAKGAIVKNKKAKGGKPKVQLSEEELNSVFNPEAMKHQMQHAVDNLKDDYVKHISVRTTGGIEKLPILIDGEKFPLNEIAQLFRKSPELLVINMTSFPEAIKTVLEALSKSGMGASSQQDGTMLYVTFPKVTRDQRQNLASNAKSRFHKARDDLKNVQDKFIKDVKKQKGTVSDDLIFNVSEHIRFVCTNYIQEAEKVFHTKEKDLLGE